MVDFTYNAYACKHRCTWYDGSMSKSVDALVLIAKAYDISAEHASNSQQEDIAQGLVYVEHKALWANNVPITQEDARDLRAADMFIKLGGVVANRLLGVVQYRPDLLANPNIFQVHRVVDAVTPFDAGESLNDYLTVVAPDRRQISASPLENLRFSPWMIKHDPEAFAAKWALAKEIDSIAAHDNPLDRMLSTTRKNCGELLQLALDDLVVTGEMLKSPQE